MNLAGGRGEGGFKSPVELNELNELSEMREVVFDVLLPVRCSYRQLPAAGRSAARVCPPATRTLARATKMMPRTPSSFSRGGAAANVRDIANNRLRRGPAVGPAANISSPKRDKGVAGSGKRTAAGVAASRRRSRCRWMFKCRGSSMRPSGGLARGRGGWSGSQRLRLCGVEELYGRKARRSVRGAIKTREAQCNCAWPLGASGAIWAQYAQ